MILGMLLFTQLSGVCAPGDAVSTLASVASTESGFDTLAIHDNTDGATYRPKDEEAARRLALSLVADQGHSVDLGLMQINSANLSRVGMSISDAFDACRSISAGARILRDGYHRALLRAVSTYNTGSEVRGFANGYVRRVEIAGSRLPALNVMPSTVDPKASVVAAAPAAPAVVLDMLHSNQVAAVPQDGVSNLLSGVAPSRAIEMISSATAAAAHPAS